MFSRPNGQVDTTRAEQPVGIRPVVHSVLAVFLSKEPQPDPRNRVPGRGINISGVDFWHAVEFSRNGRFLCTHPLGLSSGLPFGSCCVAVLRFRLYQNLSAPDSQSAGLSFRPCGRSDVSNSSSFPRRLTNRVPVMDFGMPKLFPVEGPAEFVCRIQAAGVCRRTVTAP
jgi:hypothetical protein